MENPIGFCEGNQGDAGLWVSLQTCYCVALLRLMVCLKAPYLEMSLHFDLE